MCPRRWMTWNHTPQDYGLVTNVRGCNEEGRLSIMKRTRDGSWPNSTHRSSSEIEVRAKGWPGRSGDVMVAITEGSLTTKVERGENSGRALANDHVVRALVKAFTLESGAEKTARVTVPIDPKSTRERLGAVAFLQDRKSLEVHRTTASPLP